MSYNGRLKKNHIPSHCWKQSTSPGIFCACSSGCCKHYLPVPCFTHHWDLTVYCILNVGFIPIFHLYLYFSIKTLFYNNSWEWLFSSECRVLLTIVLWCFSSYIIILNFLISISIMKNKLTWYKKSFWKIFIFKAWNAWSHTFRGL